MTRKPADGPRRELYWRNTLFLSLSPFAAVVGVSLYISRYGLQAGDLISFGLMLACTGLAVNAGYHQYYSHRSYECHPIVQLFYLFFGAAAIQQSALSWASTHRDHHRFVDQDRDPHNIQRGFFWAHMGWILYKDDPERQSFNNVRDLKTKPLVVWQHRYYLPLGLASCFLLPGLIGLGYGHPGGSVLWGGLVRVVLFHHITFLINSASHTVGSQPYSRADSSRDNWWLAFLMFGGGYHNFHHTFPGDYRSGIAWYHWDPVKWWVWSLQWFGLTWHLKRISKQTILRTQQRMRYTTDRREPEEPLEERNDQWQHQT